jgi:alpha-methylacyl-CoA racemase
MNHENMSPAAASGPLAGLRVVEFAGLGPAPFACMLLSDMGAEVVTIDRSADGAGDPANITGRGRKLVVADLKDPVARDQVLALLEHADVLVEGFRPGVMERLGLGPDLITARNPRLVYGRMTGWGQTGPLAQAAAHDINYIAVTGALHAIGAADGPPAIPLNLIGDYAGGSMFLLTGILAALHERAGSGMGQVIDAAITDGTIALMSTFVSHARKGKFSEHRQSNLLDGGAPFYGVYQTRDGEHITIGPLEPQFFAELCKRIGVSEELRRAQYDRDQWPFIRDEFTRLFSSRTRDEWTDLLEGSDACFAPVLRLSEAMRHPHHVARDAWVDIDSVRQPAPAPRFSRTPSSVQVTQREPHTLGDVLQRWRQA